jgi:biotin transport system substrate-specific component
MDNKKLSTKKMTAYALMAALMCILGPMSIQIGPIPISFTNLVIYFAAYILDTKGVFWSYLVYYLLGAVGLPVFSGFSGGVGKLVGPTGGCLVGFFFTGVLASIVVKKFKNKVLQIIGIYLASFITYLFAVLWYAYVQSCDLRAAFAVCVMPFLLIDLAKIIVSAFVADKIGKRVAVRELA